MLEADWDPVKAERNRRKHGITFEEAQSALDETNGLVLPDQSNTEERRSKTIGLSRLGRILTVITSDDGPRPRIISARRATKRERHAYERRRR